MMHHLTKAILHGGAKLIGAHLRKQALPKRIMKKGGTEDEELLCSKRARTVSKPGAMFGSTLGDLILTTRRLAYFNPGLMSSVELHLPLWKMTDIAYEKNWMACHYLSFQVDGQKFCFLHDGGAEWHEKLLGAQQAARESGDCPVF
jgi:hypothetical protein